MILVTNALKIEVKKYFFNKKIISKIDILRQKINFESKILALFDSAALRQLTKYFVFL